MVALWSMLVATLHRLVKGPSWPGWSWRLEWVVAAYREALRDSMRLHPAQMRALSMRPPSGSARRTSIQRVDLGSVSAQRLQPPASEPLRSLLYIHGGGFVVGSSDTHLDVTAALALESGARTWSIDYRLAPESPFPAA